MKKLFAFIGFSLLFIAACNSTETPPTVLDTPRNFSATATENSILLSWNTVSEATTYVLEKSSDGSTFAELQELSALSYEDQDVVVGVEYSYRLYAMNTKTQSAKVSASAIIQVVSTCGPLVQEAEDAELVGGKFVIANDEQGGNASGGKYVHIPDNDKPGTQVDSPLQPDPVHYISFCFTVETAGDYRIKTWVTGFDDSDDSFWVIVNDQDPYHYSFADVVKGTAKNAQTFPLFTEDYVKDLGVGDITVTLPVGEHTIRFHHRESDSRLDKLALELVAPTN